MIRTAFSSDLPEINELLAMHRFTPMTEDHLKDPCLVALVGGHVRGVIWASVGTSKSMAFIDYFAVNPNNKGLGTKLIMAGMSLMRRLGVKKVVSVIRAHPDFAEALRLNNWAGMKLESDLFHFATMEVK